MFVPFMCSFVATIRSHYGCGISPTVRNIYEHNFTNFSISIVFQCCCLCSKHAIITLFVKHYHIFITTYINT